MVCSFITADMWSDIPESSGELAVQKYKNIQKPASDGKVPQNDFHSEGRSLQLDSC